jgi:hypothetical protein
MELFSKLPGSSTPQNDSGLRPHVNGHLPVRPGRFDIDQQDTRKCICVQVASYVVAWSLNVACEKKRQCQCSTVWLSSFGTCRRLLEPSTSPALSLIGRGLHLIGPAIPSSLAEAQAPYAANIFPNRKLLGARGRGWGRKPAN